MNRSHIDDASPIGLLHGRQNGACGMKGAGQVDGNDGIPTLNWKVFDA